MHPIVELEKDSFMVSKLNLNIGQEVEANMKLVRFMKEDLRRASPKDFQARWQKLKPGTKVECTFMCEDAPAKYLQAKEKLPDPGQAFVYCHSCNKSFSCKRSKKYKLKKQHLDHCTPKRDFTCHICQKDFKQEFKLQRHHHVAWAKLPVKWTDYNWTGKESEIKDLFEEDFKSRVAAICFQNKLSVPGLFPGIQVSPNYMKDPNYKHFFTDYGNVSGVSFYKKVRKMGYTSKSIFVNHKKMYFSLQLLKEQYELTGCEKLTLHKNIRVKDECGRILAYFPEEVTMPKLSDSLIVKSIDDETFQIQLKPKGYDNHPWRKPQKLEDLNLTEKFVNVMKQFTKIRGGKKYPIHRYPKQYTRKYNLLRNPHMMDEGELYDYTGLEVNNFWQLCEALSKTLLQSKLKLGNIGLSLPSAVLLFR